MAEKTRTFWRDDLEADLQRAVDDYNLPDKPEFGDLAELSARTVFNGIDVHASAAVLADRKLYAPATVFVSLIYGENERGEEPISFEDTYPARVVFNVGDDGQIEILQILVDTSSFYE